MQSIIIADDHLMFGNAVKYLLKHLDEQLTVEVVTSVGEVLDQLQQGDTFDLVLLDYAMPDINGIEGLRCIRELHSSIPVGMVSGHSDTRLIRKAMEAGAVGWIPKTLSEEPLLHALRFMASGERFIPADVVEDLAQRNANAADFSEAERCVAELLIEGLGDKEIALALKVEPSTVAVHVRSLYRKTGMSNRIKFTNYYRERF